MNMNLTNLKHQTAKDVGSISKNQSLMRVTQMRYLPFLLLTISCTPLDFTNALDVDDDGDGLVNLKEIVKTTIHRCTLKI